MNCLDNIIGIKATCDGADSESISGYFITDYPGITIQSASNYNDEKTVTGLNYLQDIRRRAMMRLSNDILSYIHSSYRVNAIPSNTWCSGKYNDNTVSAESDSNIRRGIILAKKKPQCRFFKINISAVRILSSENVSTTLWISDVSGYEYSIDVELKANVIKELHINKIFEGNEIHVTLPANVSVKSNSPKCGNGCGGTDISDCVRVYGYRNGTSNTVQGYGIEVDVHCVCDLSTLICVMASQKLIGQAAYELCGAMFYDEMIKNRRLNYLTIYNSDEIKQQSMAAFDAYKGYLNNALLGIKNFLINNDGYCGCIDCNGAKILSNV